MVSPVGERRALADAPSQLAASPQVFESRAVELAPDAMAHERPSDEGVVVVGVADDGDLLKAFASRKLTAKPALSTKNTLTPVYYPDQDETWLVLTSGSPYDWAVEKPELLPHLQQEFPSTAPVTAAAGPPANAPRPDAVLRGPGGAPGGGASDGGGELSELVTDVRDLPTPTPTPGDAPGSEAALPSLPSASPARTGP